jgi:hypothetical protein
MVKKAAETKKKKTKATAHTTVHQEIKIERALTENFVALQKVMTNLSVKFDSLTEQISKLLELFEISAKSLAEKDFDIEKGNKETKEILSKIGNLSDQNKIIARGLTMLHEGEAPTEMEPPMPSMPPRPKMMAKKPIAPRPPMKAPMPPQFQQSTQEIGGEGYQKSISSNPEAPENPEEPPEKKFNRLPKI